MTHGSAETTRRRAVAYLLPALGIALTLSASAAQAHTRAARFERLSVEQGLSQSSVLCLLQDSRGFVWLGTEAGLNRYDGQSVTVYRHDVHDPSSLPNDFVWSVAESPEGDLWIATEGGGLARWEWTTDRFTRYPADPKGVSGPPSGQLRSVYVDRNGAVWVGTKDAGLARFEPKTGRWQRFVHDSGDPASLADDGVYAIAEDGAGRLWVGTNGGLGRLDGATGRFQNYRHDPMDPRSLADDHVRGIREGRDGRLWVATFGGGLDALAKGGSGFEHHRHDPKDPRSLADDFVHSVLEDASGRLWVGTRGGLNLRETDGGFTAYRKEASLSSLPDSDVLSLLEDRGGVLWFGTRAGGAARFNPRNWSFGLVTADASDDHGLANGYVTAFAEDGGGNLWVGTMGGGLHTVNHATGRMRRFRKGDQGLSGDRVMALHQGRRGALWVGTMEGGLNRLDPARLRFEVFRSDPRRPGTLTADGIVALLEDGHETLWIGTYGGGLNRLDPGSATFSAYRHDPADPTSLSRDIVTALAEDPSGALWVGTEGGGLNRLAPGARQFQRFRHDPSRSDSLADDTVYALHVDADGTLSVGTRSGLSRLEKLDAATGRAAFRSYTTSDGLAGNVVYGIESDRASRLWLSGSQGLVRFDPRTGTFQQYTASQGLQGNEFNFGAHYRSPRGELFFGGPSGYNAFSPERLPVHSTPPPVVLTGFLKFNRAVPEMGPAWGFESLKLGHRDSVVSFDFGVLDYAAPERNRIAYKLDGFDRDWSDLGSARRVTFTNLDPGRYVLRVRAANGDGAWSDESLALPLDVAPPPWRSPWAHAGYALALAGAVAALVHRQRRKAALEGEYRRRLEEEVQARTLEISERNEELGKLNAQLVETSLTDSLTGLRNRRYVFEQVSLDLRAVQRQHRAVRAGVHHEADQLLFLMVDLDWFKPINDTCGHAAGDRVLVQVRDVLREACRDSDALVRWGGDEFLVIGRASDLEGVDALPERIRSLIERSHFDLGDGQVAHLTCSIGFTCYPAGLGDLERLSLEQVVNLADRALYAAKKAGRNAWVGLIGTPSTDIAEVERWMRGEPDSVVRADIFDVRRSDDNATSGIVSEDAGSRQWTAA